MFLRLICMSFECLESCLRVYWSHLHVSTSHLHPRGLVRELGNFGGEFGGKAEEFREKNGGKAGKLGDKWEIWVENGKFGGKMGNFGENGKFEKNQKAQEKIGENGEKIGENFREMSGKFGGKRGKNWKISWEN